MPRRAVRFPDAFSWNEPFTYANGNLPGRGGWQISSLAQPTIVSNAIKRPSASGSANADHAWACRDLNLNVDFAVTLTVVMPLAPSVSSTFEFITGEDIDIGIFPYDGGGGVGVADIVVTWGNAAVLLTAAAFAWNATHTVKSQRVDNNLLVYVDGVLMDTQPGAAEITEVSHNANVRTDASVFATSPTITTLLVEGTQL